LVIYALLTNPVCEITITAMFLNVPMLL
ncbi:MAG: hypothetical protein ACJARN_002135, partial [Arenicella sp.]